MESRKRPHSTEDEPTIQKKRILTGVNGAPHVNGVVSESEDPKDTDNLEVGAFEVSLSVGQWFKCICSSFERRLSSVG